MLLCCIKAFGFFFSSQHFSIPSHLSCSISVATYPFYLLNVATLPLCSHTTMEVNLITMISSRITFTLLYFSVFFLSFYVKRKKRNRIWWWRSGRGGEGEIGGEHNTVHNEREFPTFSQEVALLHVRIARIQSAVPCCDRIVILPLFPPAVLSHDD